MNTRDGYRIVLGYIGIVAGLGSLIGYGAPSVNGFFEAQAAQRLFEGILLVGGILCWAAFAVSRGVRRTASDVKRGRQSDLLETVGLFAIGICAIVAAYAAIDFSYHGAGSGIPGDFRRTLQSSSTFAFETGAALGIAFRLRRLLDYEDIPVKGPDNEGKNE